MYLNLAAESATLSSSHAEKLDDEFFLADPVTYFSSRIAALLAAQHDADPPTSANEPEFFEALGLSGEADVLTFDPKARRIQLAVDALALRHHVAEALVRFLYAARVAEPKGRDAPCTWLAVADSPNTTIKLLEANKQAADADPHLVAKALFPPGTEIGAAELLAYNTALAWVNHANNLLANNELSVNAAHNKFKHGLAVNVRGDVRIDLVAMASLPEDGELPLSTFADGKAVPLFDRPMLTHLARPAGVEPKQGVEALSLRVDLPIVLAEAWMMARVYGAMFHVAALRHFGEEVPDAVAPYPKLVAGRMPEHVLAGALLGYRQAVTLPPDGTTPARPSILFFSDQSIPLTVDLQSKVSAVIVDD